MRPSGLPWFLALLLAGLGGCADDPEGIERGYTGPVTDGRSPVSMHEAWAIADAAAEAWGGEVYRLAGTEVHQDIEDRRGRSDPDLGDGVLPYWDAEIRDPVSMDGLHLRIHAEGVASWTAWSAERLGSMQPASQWNLTPPPGQDWLDRLQGSPHWTTLDTAYSVDWTWWATSGLRVDRSESSSSYHPVSWRFDHAGNLLLRQFGWVVASEDIPVHIHEGIAFIARHDIPEASVRLVSPDGEEHAIKAGDHLVVEEPTPGHWSVESELPGGSVYYCTTGLDSGAYGAGDEACQHL